MKMRCGRLVKMSMKKLPKIIFDTPKKGNFVLQFRVENADKLHRYAVPINWLCSRSGAKLPVVFLTISHHQLNHPCIAL